ncbi:MAG: hypothetical protein ACLUOI_01750 [Eisenbergiella sp.]
MRKDGRKGIRNRLLVIYTVECAAFVAKFPDRAPIRKQNAWDSPAVQTISMLSAFSSPDHHPNVGIHRRTGL